MKIFLFVWAILILISAITFAIIRLFPNSKVGRWLCAVKND